LTPQALPITPKDKQVHKAQAMVMKAMKARKPMKVANKNKTITKLMPSKNLPNNKIKHEAIPKHLLSTKTTKTLGDGAAKIKRIAKCKTMLRDTLCKKPAANMVSKAIVSGPESVAKRYGLHEVTCNQYEKRVFKKKMEDAMQLREKGMCHDVPDEVLDEYMQLANMQGNHGQQHAIDLLRKAWKVDPTWGHVLITDKITRSQSKTIKDIQKAMIWLRMCAKLGGEPPSHQGAQGGRHLRRHGHERAQHEALHHAGARGRAGMAVES